MSYLDPIADASAYFDALSAQQEAQQRAENTAILAFIAACQKVDANALADFAPMTADWDAVRAAPRSAGAPMPMKLQTLAEVISGSLDIGNGPSTTELMQLVLSLAFSADAHANQASRARQFLASAAAAFASANVVVEA